MTLLSEPDLHGHDAALVVDPHEDAENRVEKDPGRHKRAGREAGFRKADGAEDEGNRGEEKPGFLVRIEGKEECSRQSGEEGQPR